MKNENKKMLLDEIITMFGLEAEETVMFAKACEINTEKFCWELYFELKYENPYGGCLD